MAITRSMTRNQSYNASSTKRIKTCDDDGVAPWSDLNNDLLDSVMTRLGVVDFIAFSGVCKSWRSRALSNKNLFMVSRPPMYMSISLRASKKVCILEDFEGRKFKTTIPRSSGRTCVGLTCGYLILYNKKTNDLRLVNPITRHELHFLDVPIDAFANPTIIRAILVFSLSLSRWVFVMANLYQMHVAFCIAGKGAWNHVSSTFPVTDLHAFKGKIYTLHTLFGVRHVCEMRLGLESKLMKLEIKNTLITCFEKFVNWGGHLYLVQYRWLSGDLYKVQELDFGEMKWVCCEATRENYAFFVSLCADAIKPELWAAHQIKFWRYAGTDKSRKGKFNYANMWYFPHDCLNVNLIRDS